MMLSMYFSDFEGSTADLITGMLLLAKYHKSRPVSCCGYNKWPLTLS